MADDDKMSVDERRKYLKRMHARYRARLGGGLPSSDLTEFSSDGADIWLGTAGHGLIHLVDPETNGSIHPTPAQGTREPDEPTPTPIPVVTHLPEKNILPAFARCDASAAAAQEQ